MMSCLAQAESLDEPRHNGFFDITTSCGSTIYLRTERSEVRTEADGVGRQAEPRSGDEAAKLPCNLSGYPNDSKSYQAISTSRANPLVFQHSKCGSFA